MFRLRHNARQNYPISNLSGYYACRIIHGRLEANGIGCFIADDNVTAMNPLYNNALGGVKLKIFEKDLERCK